MSLPDPGPWKGFDLHKKDQDKLFLNQLVQIIQFVLSIIGSPASLAKFINNYLTFTNVLVYGADPTGASDSTTAITNAIASMTNGGTLYFPTGTYKISGTITLSKSGTVLGDGQNSSIITTTSATADMFLCTVGNIEIRGLGFSSSVTRTAGYCVNVSSSSFNWINIKNFTMTAAFNGIHCIWGFGKIADGFLFNVIGTGIQIDSGNSVVIENVLQTFASGTSSFGIAISQSASMMITNSQFYHCATGISIVSSGGTIDAIQILNTVVDTGTVNGILIQSNLAANVITDVFINGLEQATHSSRGVILNTTSTGIIDGVVISNSYVVHNGNDGIALIGVAGSILNTRMVNNTIAGNGTAAAAAGIVLGSGITGFQIIGNRIGNARQLAGNNQYGINFGGANDDLIVLGNDLRGNTTSELNLPPATSATVVIADNI